MKLNFNNVGCDPVPPGIYEFKVINGEWKACSTRYESGPLQGQVKNMITWTFEIANGEFAGRKVFHNSVFNPENAFYFFQPLRAMGVAEAELESGEYDVEPARFIGKRFKAQTKITPATNGYDEKTEIKKFIIPNEKNTPPKSSGPKLG